MKSYIIHDKKQFMAALFTGDAFHHFFLKELHIDTKITHVVDGRIHPEFYTSDERKEMTAELSEYVLWSEVRPLAFDMIRGKKTPLRFTIVFLATPAEQIQSDASAISYLNLTVRFENNTCHVISGCAYQTFSLDKDAEKEWDNALATFLSSHQISFEED